MRKAFLIVSCFVILLSSFIVYSYADTPATVQSALQSPEVSLTNNNRVLKGACVYYHTLSPNYRVCIFTATAQSSSNFNFNEPTWLFCNNDFSIHQDVFDVITGTLLNSSDSRTLLYKYRYYKYKLDIYCDKN